MAIEFKVSATFPGSPELIYNTWLSSEGHSAMTGDKAEAGQKTGQSFSAYDGYIWGHNIELVPFERIVQSWRTTEFSEDEADSLLEITLTADGEDTHFDINHSNLPLHGMTYRQGWIDHYFEPMTVYFSSL